MVAGDPETVLARLRALGDAGAAWCVLATVGGPGAEMRALLAAAAPVRAGTNWLNVKANSDGRAKASGNTC